MRHWFAGLLIVALASTVGAAEPEVKIGARVANLTFKDIRFLERSLDDFKDARGFVVVFTSTSCPLVPRYLPTLNRLEKEYRDKKVQFIGVNVGADDSIPALAAFAVKHQVEFPQGKDFDGTCVRVLGVTRTPQVVVLDAERKLRYRGRIDDQYRIGGARPEPTRNDLKEAIDSVLAKKEVAIAETPVDGCLITFPELPTPKSPLTFAEHVAPILHKHCAGCHRPGTAAPFSLLTFEQAAAKASTIAEVVRDQSMPPWYASPEHKEFTNRRSLNAKEREIIQQWVKGGKRKGDLSKLPKEPAVEASRWEIGKPDLVIQAPEHELEAEGVIDYKYVILPHLFKEDTWVQGVQILPDNPRVLHHCNMAFVTLKEGFKMTNFITGYVPGGSAMVLENNVGFKIPKGAMLALQIHYVTTGKPEKCRISVGLKHASGKVDQHLHFLYVVDNRFAIPPGAPAHQVKSSRTLPCEAEGVGLFSHMHTRGRDMTFTAHYPEGKSETLLLIPNFSFDWQMPYVYPPGKRIFPKGTRIECVAHYDNSAFNPFNPDPKVTVREGQQTFHEMMNGFFFYVDRGEKLGLDIDGKTGRVKEEPKK